MAPRFLSQEWLYKPGKRQRTGRDVAIANGLHVVQRVHKATGGLLRATMEVGQDRLHNVSLSGDFFCYPGDGVTQLETVLEGISLSQVPEVLRGFYTGYEIPGVTADDWLKALVG